MPFSEVFRLHGRLRGGRAALRQGARTIDFRSLDRRIDGLCHALAGLGLRRGEIAGVALRDSPEHMIALLALARLGTIILPMDWRWTEREKLAVAGRYSARHVLAEELPSSPAPGDWHLVDDGWFAESDRPYLDPGVTDESPLLLSLSSGTTGLPKGPCVTHRQFENRFMAYWLNLGMNAHDTFVLATPLYHGGGRGFALGTLFGGGTVSVFPPPYTPAELAAHVAEVRGSSMFLVPTLLRRMLEAKLPAPAFPTMRKLISSGSMLYPEERRAVRERLTPHLYELYSSTEGGACSVMGPDDIDIAPDSVGRPAFRVDVEVVDELHRPLPAGEVGRLRYRSPASPREYFIGDGSDAFRDGWFYPGDLACLDAQGYVYLRGRVKDMIIRGGVNIFPGDVEKVLIEHPGVSDAAVVGTPSRDLGEELVAFVVRTQALTREDLIAHCQGRLAPYKIPKRIAFLDELPRNSSGKVVRADLSKLAEKVTAP